MGTRVPRITGLPCCTPGSMTIRSFIFLHPFLHSSASYHISPLHGAAFPGGLVLDFLAQIHEVGIVAGDPHQQVTVGVRVILGSAQGVRADDVDLQRRAAHLVVGTQQGGQLAAMLD